MFFHDGRKKEQKMRQRFDLMRWNDVEWKNGKIIDFLSTFFFFCCLSFGSHSFSQNSWMWCFQPRSHCIVRNIRSGICTWFWTQHSSQILLTSITPKLLIDHLWVTFNNSTIFFCRLQKASFGYLMNFFQLIIQVTKQLMPGACTIKLYGSVI